MVDIAKFFLEFIIDESCGKCSPCRIGTKRLYDLLTKITEGNGTLEDLTTIEELCEHIKQSALCGLGQTAPNPVLSTLHHFRDEYIRSVQEPPPLCHRSGQVQGLHPLRQELPGQRHHGRGEGPPRHRPQ